MKNECGKTRDVSNPYEIWEGRGQMDGWVWHVLKKGQTPDKEADNPYARWFCAVKSPMTYGEFEYGDCYVSDVTGGNVLQVKGKPDLRTVIRQEVDKGSRRHEYTNSSNRSRTG